MKLEIRKKASLAPDTVLAAFAFEEGPESHPWNGALEGLVEQLYKDQEFSGKAFELSLVHRAKGVGASRAALAGAGKRANFNPTEARRAAGAAARSLKGKGVRSFTFELPADLATPAIVQAVAEGFVLAAFEPDHLKTDPDRESKSLSGGVLVVPELTPELQSAFDRGVTIAESQNFARELVNLPANVLTPLVLADRAREMAEAEGLECEVLDRDRMQQLGMGSLLGVAQGSLEPPALIILRYNPESAASEDHLALVGKGVTFDTGGVSIKPSEGMEKMKYDMAGGAAVIGAMRAIARLKPNVRVTGFVPAVENMVSGKAQRPGDIVKSLNGKTVEVLNTDAEGRLILIDAMTYAIRQGCTHLVDAATLTGAIAVALGHIYAGAFTNDQAMLDRVMTAAGRQGERLWHMPLDDDYKDYLKSAFADLPNIGGRWGGAITAAYFLKEFTEGKPWVHLDIAGTAWLDDGKPFLAKGPSGMGVRTFVDLALSWKS
jgi:leucyl aminopeptidase